MPQPRFLRLRRSLVPVGLVLLLVAPARSGDKEPKFLTDTNFFGKDIRDFDLPEESPRLCYQACVEDQHCHAFTYLRPYGWPGAGSQAHCWLKYATPADVRHERCCVSGVVRPGEDPPPPPPPTKPEPPEHIPLPPVGANNVKLYADTAVYKGSCPASIGFRGVITVSGRGTVTYALTQDKGIRDIHQLEFRSAGSKEVSTSIAAGTPGLTQDVHETLSILGRVYCVRAPCPEWIPEMSADAVTTVICDNLRAK